MGDEILIEKQDGVATVTFNRPDQRNAINYHGWLELQRIAIDLEHDDDVRVVVFTGAGEDTVGLGDDETTVSSPLYYGSGEIVGLPAIPDLSVTVIGDEFVIGVSIIRRYRITLDYGERVIVEV